MDFIQSIVICRLQTLALRRGACLVPNKIGFVASMKQVLTDPASDMYSICWNNHVFN